MILMLVFVGCASFGALALKRYNQDSSLEHRIASTPFSAVRALKPGTIKLSGRVASGHTVEAPLTGRSCAYFAVLVERQGSIAQGRAWQDVRRHSSDDKTLALRDGTGDAIIDPTGMTLMTRDVVTIETAKETDLPERVRRFYDSLPQPRGFELSQHVRFTEHCFQTGDLLYALGTVVIIPGTARQLKVVREGHEPAIAATLPEKLVVTMLDSSTKRSGDLAVLGSGGAVILLGLLVMFLKRGPSAKA